MTPDERDVLREALDGALTHYSQQRMRGFLPEVKKLMERRYEALVALRQRVESLQL